MLALIALTVALAAKLINAVPTITVQGADFVNAKTGDRFQIVGVAYQPGGSSGYLEGVLDPLSNGTSCLRDAALMQQLGVNTIRVYNVDPNLDHDLCMSIFNTVGIYVALDVNSPLPGESIDRSAPWTTYTTSYLNRTFGVVEAFKNFPNTLLFFSGNEVINDDTTGGIDGPYMRAVTRDIKNYIAKHSSRSIPVGYSAADVRDILVDTWNYLQCTTTPGTDDPSRVDLFALNSYSWCGNATYQTSGYDVLQADFASTSVPVFFSEYGCNEVTPRIFTEVETLYGPLMTEDLSGGLVYEWTEGTNNYGLVTINDDGSVNILDDYDTLQTRYAALNFTLLEGVKAENSSNTPPTCSSSIISSTAFNSNFTIPDIPSGAADLISNGLTNPNQGKLVTVTQTTVQNKVTAANGQVLTGLKITAIADDASNTPSGVTNSSTTTSSSGAAATSSKAAAVGNSELNKLRGIVVGVLGVVAIL